MTIGTRRQFQAAIDKARVMGGARGVEALGGGRYAVFGSRGDRYIVTVDADGEYSDTCPAGTNGIPCYHQAKVWLKRLGEQAATPSATPILVTLDVRLSAALARTADPITRRTSGRGIGISPADLGDDDDLPTLAEQLAALGHKAA